MDLTTLSFLLALLATTLGLDTVLHPASVVLDTAIPAKYDRVAVDVDTISAILNAEVEAISSTPSVVAGPEIRVGSPKGIGMALAEAVKMQSVALALQYEAGYVPEQIRLAVLGEDGTTKILVSGSGLGGRIRTPAFETLVTLRPGESLVDLVHRAAIVGLGRIDPYFTALHLIQRHAKDRDFSEATALIATTLAALPPTPASTDRALFENLQGIIALFQDDRELADRRFHQAAATDPGNAVAWLNAAFTDVQRDQFREAVEHVQRVTTMQPAPDRTLLATAYMTWGAALLGLKDVHGADRMLAKSVEINPESSAAHELWSEIKREKGNQVAAERLARRAMEVSDRFENFTEVAALWFRLAWKEDRLVSRSTVNPVLLRFNR